MALVSKLVVECVTNFSGAFGPYQPLCASAPPEFGTREPGVPAVSFVFNDPGDVLLWRQLVVLCDPTCPTPAVIAGDTIDYASLGAIWTFGFVSVLIFWLVAKNAGIIVNAVRRL